MQSTDTEYRRFIGIIADNDAEAVHQKDEAYGASWKKRGGAGAYMVMIRKADRLEEQCKQHGYDIFKAIQSSAVTDETVLDTIRDLRRYLILIEAEAYAQGIATPESFPDIELAAGLYEGDPHDGTGPDQTQ